MKHAHQTTKPRPDLAKYPMPTAETAWAIAQEFVAARRRVLDTMRPGPHKNRRLINVDCGSGGW